MVVEQDRRPRLSTREVAEMFHVTRVTLTRWIKDGRVPAPPRDPDSGRPIWGQTELNAVARAIETKRRGGRDGA